MCGLSTIGRVENHRERGLEYHEKRGYSTKEGVRVPSVEGEELELGLRLEGGG